MLIASVVAGAVAGGVVTGVVLRAQALRGRKRSQEFDEAMRESEEMLDAFSAELSIRIEAGDRIDYGRRPDLDELMRRWRSGFSLSAERPTRQRSHTTSGPFSVSREACVTDIAAHSRLA